MWILLYFFKKHSNLKLALYGTGLLIIATLLLFPYAMTTIASKTVSDSFISLKLPSGPLIWTIILVLAPYWLLLILLRKKVVITFLNPSYLLLLTGIVIVCCLFLTVRLGGLEYKYIFPLSILLSLYCASMVPYVRPKKALIIWIIVFSTLPTTLSGLVAYCRDPGQGELICPQAVYDVFSWIEANTPINAVIIDRKNSVLVPFRGNRDEYMCDYAMLPHETYAPRREKLKEQLLSSVKKREILGVIAREVRRPVYFITYGKEAVNEPQISLVHSVGDIRVWYFDDSK